MRDTAVTPERLARRHPEWGPWLGLIAETQRAVADPAWQAFVPALPAHRREDAPMLMGARIAIERRLVSRWARRLLGRAAEVAEAARLLHEALVSRRLDALDLLEAAIVDAPGRYDSLAGALDTAPPVLDALAPLIAMPLLHAARGALAGAAPPTWGKGYCPVCGAWPIVAEELGLERARRLRCHRCGADWRGDWLRCPYCDERDHTQLGGLVAGTGDDTRRVETCSRCRGYLKVMTRLQATPPAELALDDLTSVELDVAALDQGYARPRSTGYALAVNLVEAPRTLGAILGWRR